MAQLPQTAKKKQRSRVATKAGSDFYHVLGMCFGCVKCHDFGTWQRKVGDQPGALCTFGSETSNRNQIPLGDVNGKPPTG